MRTTNQIFYPAGIYHVTWVTHRSRVSQRMVDYHIKKEMAVWLDEKAEIIPDYAIEHYVSTRSSLRAKRSNLSH